MTTPSVTAAFPWNEGEHYEVDPSTGCWNWTGTLRESGHGSAYTPELGAGTAHHLAWEGLHGPLPQRVHVHHLCENKACVNPAHLEAISHNEHSRRHGRAKSHLTEEDIIAMRTAVYEGEKIYEVAARYGVTATTCGLICQGKKWPGVGGPIGAKPKNCAWCDTPLPLDSTRNPRKRKYCDDACRIAATNANVKAKRAAQ